MLDKLVEDVRAGDSRALVIYGEPGVGKSALLDYLAENASECRVARTTGVQSEMELPFAALQQLCAPMLDRLERIPAPQRDALRHCVRAQHWAAGRSFSGRTCRLELALRSRLRTPAHLPNRR